MIRSTVRLAAVAAAASLAACEQTAAPNALDREITLSVAQASGQTVAGDVAVSSGLAREAMGIGSLLVADGATAAFDQMGPGGSGPRVPNGCVRLPIPIPTFNCGPIRRGPSLPFGSREFERVVRYFDADGVAQEGYDPVTTARIEYTITESGSFSRTRGRMTMSDTSSRSRTAILTGIAGDPDTQHIWNGESSGQHVTSRTNPAGTFRTEMTSSGSATDVIFDLPRAEHPWPKSGTVEYTMTVVRTKTVDGEEEARTRTRTVVVTFNGTNLVEMTVNGEAFELDLATGEVTPKA